jgi:hypothetical protein
MAVHTFERFFRAAASLDVDKQDIERHSEFVHDKLADLMVRAEGVAKANLRDLIEPWDLPITKGLQERIHEFDKLDDEIELEPILGRLATWPQLELEITEETKLFLPRVAGGLSVALAHAFKIIDPDLKNPQTAQWERAFELFDLLL